MYIWGSVRVWGQRTDQAVEAYTPSRAEEKGGGGSGLGLQGQKAIHMEMGANAWELNVCRAIFNTGHGRTLIKWPLLGSFLTVTLVQIKLWLSAMIAPFLEQVLC